MKKIYKKTALNLPDIDPERLTDMIPSLIHWNPGEIHEENPQWTIVTDTGDMPYKESSEVMRMHLDVIL